MSELWDVPRSAIRTPLRVCFAGSEGKREHGVDVKVRRGWRRRHCDESDTGRDGRDVCDEAVVIVLDNGRHDLGG